ncbi:hypothetical protein AUR64_16475 [Haloprofundus marisrubri]|uniref:Uncharacterized protein n=1 Tax=Haloprofundus marisrubri TaxID=1514971 RepID=A0A0W1R7H7_9EURY|nr:hypothetical protein [Haloprofundus marisrubri]KTG09374.1 hypothetical protein AUR64_16475 [Haloprofundus marisrubri]
MQIRSKHCLLALSVTVALVSGGCLGFNPSVTAETNDSAVFESISPTEQWSGSGVRVSAELKSTPEARNVTTITILSEDGSQYSTVERAPGETSVVFSLPLNQNSTIVSSNNVNSTTIESLNVTTSGDALV